MMKIHVSKVGIHRALSLVQSLVERKTTMPILANVLLSTGDGILRISATDLEITTVVQIPTEVQTAGSITVNARILSELVRELPEGQIKFEVTEGNRLNIQAGRSNLTIIGVSAEEYPSLPGISLQPSAKIEAAKLLEMIHKSIYAVSNDETRFSLNGVCFELVNEKKGATSLRLVATDGHRLSMVTRPVEGLQLSERVIVPKKGLSEIRKILDAEINSEVGFDIQEGFLIVETSDSKISTRLTDGEFPEYQQVLPKDAGSIAKVPSSELAQALRRVVLMVTDKAKGVEFQLSKNILRVSSSSPELGEAKEEIPVEYSGDDLRVGFNARYVLDIIGSLGDGGNLIIEFHKELGPGKFWSENDESSVAIVMPMRLN